MNFTQFIVLFFLIGIPGVALWCEKKSAVAKKLGAIILCYAFGILLGNCGWQHQSNDVINHIMSASIPLAIPLFLFGTDFLGWLKQSKKTVFSFLLCVGSVSFVSFTFGFIFKDLIEDVWQLSGMLAGVYTGGTFNLTAIGKSLEAKNELIILANTFDMLASSVLLLILLYYGPRFLKNYLNVLEVVDIENHSEEFIKKKSIKDALTAFFLSLVVFGISYFLNILLFAELNVPLFIFTLTTLSICCSFIKKIRELSFSYDIGHYLLMIFCIAIGALSDLSQMFENANLKMLLVFLVVAFSFILHIFLSKIFNIDRDTAIATSVAAIYGPPFVPIIADRFQNKNMILPGITTGLVGFAIGNYVGLTIAYLLRSII